LTKLTRRGSRFAPRSRPHPRALLAAIVASVLAYPATSTPATATPLLYTFSGATLTFSGGTDTLTGSFTYDPSTQTLSAPSSIIVAGPVFAGTYDQPLFADDVHVIGGQIFSQLEIESDPATNPAIILQLGFAEPLGLTTVDLGGITPQILDHSQLERGPIDVGVRDSLHGHRDPDPGSSSYP